MFRIQQSKRDKHRDKVNEAQRNRYEKDGEYRTNKLEQNHNLI